VKRRFFRGKKYNNLNHPILLKMHGTNMEIRNSFRSALAGLTTLSFASSLSAQEATKSNASGIRGITVCWINADGNQSAADYTIRTINGSNYGISFVIDISEVASRHMTLVKYGRDVLVESNGFTINGSNTLAPPGISQTLISVVFAMKEFCNKYSDGKFQLLEPERLPAPTKPDLRGTLTPEP
jgi:hypothetical protein